MVNEPALRDALLALVTQGRASYVMLSALMNELASLRETVRGLDPTFGDVMEIKQKHYAEISADTVQSVLALYDESGLYFF